MEVSLRYVFVRLEAILPFIFAMFYIAGGAVDTADNIQKIEIKDRVNILTGICIAIFYLYKLVKEIGKKDEIENIKKRLDALEQTDKENDAEEKRQKE